MTTWTTKNIGYLKCLNPHDIVVFPADPGYHYVVQSNFLRRATEDGGYDSDNDRIFTLLGLDKKEFCAEHYGAAPVVGRWPEPPVRHEHEIRPALTRAVKALFKECKKPGAAKRIAAAQAKAATEKAKAEAEKAKAEKAKAAADRKRATVLKKFPPKARKVVAYLNDEPDAFGCQRRHVVAIVSALLGKDIKPALDHPGD